MSSNSDSNPMRVSTIVSGLLLVLSAQSVAAQQKIAYMDSEYILGRLPEYATVQQQLDRLSGDWQKELDAKKRDLDNQFREYQSRELLYTPDERQRKRQEIVRAENELEQLRTRYFGPDGEIFTRQEQLMRPLQERILEAVDQVATSEGYDFVFDISGDFLFMFRRQQYNVSDLVLSELGIDLDGNQ